MSAVNQIEHPDTKKTGNEKDDARTVYKRRSSRVVIDIPVTLFAQNSSRKMIEVHTSTLTVSAHGALISVKSEIDPTRPVLLANPKTGMDVQCRVAYRKDSAEGLVELGLEFSNPLPRFWGIHFPPDDWNPAERKKATSHARPVINSSRGSKK